jgi:hypothetical protein
VRNPRNAHALTPAESDAERCSRLAFYSPIGIDGVQLLGTGDDLSVVLEIGGRRYRVVRESAHGLIDHCVSSGGIREVMEREGPLEQPRLYPARGARTRKRDRGRVGSKLARRDEK